MYKTTAVMTLAAAARAAVMSTAVAATVDDCSTRTVCADYVNDCGMKYGGCFADCTPWPAFTPPPCPGNSSTASPTSYVVSVTSTADNCSTRSVCADYINECGMWYGGCFADCTPWPTFTPPPCPSNSSTAGVASTTSSAVSGTPTSSRLACSKPSSTSSKPCGGDVACTTSYRDCSTTQLPFGGCWPACSPKPLYTPPPCPQAAATSSSSSGPAAPVTTVEPYVATLVPPVTTPVPPATPTTSNSSLPCGGATSCATYFRTCPATTLTFGGCWPACSSRPFYTAPPCPASTSSA